MGWPPRSENRKELLALDSESLFFTVSGRIFFIAHLRCNSVQQAKECIIMIDSNEDINGDFSCLINEKETGTENKLIHDAKEATGRVLRKARRQKRKYDNTIIIS